MALERIDNIGDTTTSTGTGTINLAAVAQTGALIFAGNVTSGATVRYDIRSSDNTEWEIGEGVFTDGSPDTLTRVTVYKSSNAGSLVNFSAGTKNVSMVITSKDVSDIAPQNLLKNGNFINNSTNGYGSTPDDWTSSNANPVQGGIPALTKQNLIDILGVGTGDIEGLWPLNEASGNALDLSDNAYNLTDTNTVGVSSDGLMATARDFELANTEYFTIADASCPNLEIAGSQTWFAFVKPETVGSGECFIGKSTGENYNILQTAALNVAQFQLLGLTTNTVVSSDVALQTGKWYMIVGIYDSANSKLKIWVNGIKKEVTASGTHTDSNATFNIGRTGGTSNNYADGLIQNACVLSVALTDNQVKKLFAATMYKGLKIRRATTNAIQYEDLPMSEVEKLRGKTVALRADMYQDTASTGQISLLVTLADASTSETIISATDATTGSWLEKVATGTIGSTAVAIRVQLKHSTSDGNTWFRNVSLYEGSTLLPYDHSKEDWSRFPDILKLDFPAVLDGYRFEEFKVHTYTPTGVAATNVTLSGQFRRIGKMVKARIAATFTGAITFTTDPTLPAKVSASYIITPSQGSTNSGTGGYFDSGTLNSPAGIVPSLINSACVCHIGQASNGANLSATVPITWANGDGFVVETEYLID